jgi:hypothetical protein
VAGAGVRWAKKQLVLWRILIPLTLLPMVGVFTFYLPLSLTKHGILCLSNSFALFCASLVSFGTDFVLIFL